MMDTPEVGALLTPAEETQTGGIAEVGPSVPAVAEESLVTIPMGEDQVKEWLDRIQKSDDLIKQESAAWESLLQSYTPKIKGPNEAEEVNSNRHFRNVHTKLGQMFVTTPEVRLEPAPNSPAENQRPNPTNPMVPIALGDIIAVKQEILNKKLGRDGIKVNRLFDELIIDVLSCAGLGCSKLGYRAYIKKVPQPVMGPDPNFVPPPPPMGNVLGLSPTPQPPMVQQVGPDGQPMTQMVPVTVYDETYWRRFSPKKLVTDASLFSTRHDEDATLLGMRFSMMPTQAQGAFALTEDEVTGGGDDEYRLQRESGADQRPKVITGVEIFYKACYYLPDEVHPWKLVQLVFLDHIKDRPVVHRFCQDQEFTEEGELTEDSIDRFPIRVMTIRDFPDSQFPPADSAFTNNLIKQQNTMRRQGVALRNKALGRTLYDQGAFDDGELAKIKNAQAGEWIGVQPGLLEKGVNSIAASVEQATRTQDDYRLDAILGQDQDETLGISANSSGAAEDTVRSATEIQTISKAVQGRNVKERGRVIDHFLDGVRLIDILTMRYTTTQQWAKVTGENGAQIMMAWNGEMVSGRWLYDIAPDSQLEVDTAQDRQQHLTLYNLVAQDPLVNRIPILQRIFRSFGYDAAKCVINPALTGMVPGNVPHGGPVNKHETERSGGKENAPGADNHREAVNP